MKGFLVPIKENKSEQIWNCLSKIMEDMDKDPFVSKKRYREKDPNDDSIVKLYQSMPDNQLRSWDEILEKVSMEFSEVFRLFKLLLKPALRESMRYLETLADQLGYRGLIEERLEDVNNTIKYLSAIVKITSIKSVNKRINGINAQFMAAKDLLATATSKLEVEEDKNKKERYENYQKEQEVLNESKEVFFEIAAKANMDEQSYLQNKRSENFKN
jgi:hypothetical protein